jgi:formate hydrogenlyase transcriptional activator
MAAIQVIIVAIVAGVALSMGVISLLVGLHRHGEKTDLVFGILCILQFFFLISPPFGLVKSDHAPYAADLLIKRAFNYSFSGLFPWFVFYYSGYKNKVLPTVIGSLAGLCYLGMAFNRDNSPVPLFVYPILICLALIIIHGFQGVRYMKENGERRRAASFRLAMYIFLLLYIVSATYQLGNAYFMPVFHQRVFFPVNLFPIAFIVIMGIRLRTHSIQKFQLEKILGIKNQEWESLLNHIQLIIVRLDRDGNIRYINPYAVRLLQYDSYKEIIGKNWFSYFLPGPESNAAKEIFANMETHRSDTTFFKNSIITRDGLEKIVTWNNELFFDENQKINGIMSIGSDITDQELAFQRIKQLKSELEKENLLLKGEPLPEWMLQEIIGKSDALIYAVQKAGKVATSQASVLLEGETGVGKELFAELIQRNSSRVNEPFVKINCGALPAELIEDELFGHEKGAFTGASQMRKGRFEIAQGGTIFLDEIGELPLSLQPKLLRVLQNGEFERIGGQQTIKIDVRIIAATNRNLKTEVEEGRFRDDLYYRLNVFPITIPPLRSRKEDIPMLVRYFIERKSQKHSKSFKSISKADLNNLVQYGWPGNIRELKNVIERSVISSDNNQTLKLDWFYEGIQEEKGGGLPKSLEQIEKEHIIKVLQECHWRVSGDHGAAERLTMNPNTLRSKMRKLKINRETVG